MSKPALMLDRRKVLLGLGLCAASGVAYARQPTPNRPRVPVEKLEEMIPNQLGAWRYETASGLVLPPADALSERLYDSLVTRIYSNPAGHSLMMLIAYNNRQDGVLQIHRPEVCYPAGGYVLTPTQRVDVPLRPGVNLPCQAFVAQSRQRDEAVMYWTRLGGDFPRRWADQRLAVVKANLKGIVPDGLLVRVSTIGRDMDAQLPVMSGFVESLARLASPRLGQLLFDSLGAGPRAGAAG